MWLIFSRLLAYFISLLAIGSAKVSRSFELASEQRRFFIFLVCSLCGELHSVNAIRGAKVRRFFNFQTSFSTFVAKTDLNFETVNPVDSWRGAKVRGFLEEPRRRRNFFFRLALVPSSVRFGSAKVGRIQRK